MIAYIKKCQYRYYKYYFVFLTAVSQYLSIWQIKNKVLLQAAQGCSVTIRGQTFLRGDKWPDHIEAKSCDCCLFALAIMCWSGKRKGRLVE